MCERNGLCHGWTEWRELNRQYIGKKRLVVISDYQAGWSVPFSPLSLKELLAQWASGARGSPCSAERPFHDLVVEGGYIERLPLACLKMGIVDIAEVWTHWRGACPPPEDLSTNPFLVRRSFAMNGPEAPFASNDMLAHILTFGAPDILCVWGLGVSEDILIACKSSYKIYNSIDAPTWRVPPSISQHFDLVLTGALWQSQEVNRRHPEMKTAVLPIGPEFASESMFYPLDGPRRYDVIYVAAAQAYKRHDILFDALAKLPHGMRALCVCGYGELGNILRAQVQTLGIDVDFVGPPGVPYAEVNSLMNQAKIGVVCGINDGAPAILTEYMLAGLPVLANSALVCGLQYITPRTGETAAADDFHHAILSMLENLSNYSPRQVVLENWTWPHSVRKLCEIMDSRAGQK